MALQQVGIEAAISETQPPSDGGSGPIHPDREAPKGSRRSGHAARDCRRLPDARNVM